MQESDVMNKKIAVIGLDGMAWHILHKLFEYDAMPYLKKIVEQSLKGILESTIPPSTVPAWTSIASGVNPGKHGLFDFVALTKDYEPRLLTSKDVGYPRVHEMVALKGLRSVCINQPLTYPIMKFGKNAVIVSDWLGPRICYYPESTEKYMKDYSLYTAEIWDKSKDEASDALYEETEKRVDGVNLMMQDLDWDLFWVIYSEPDHVFHHFCEDVLKADPKMLRIFRKIDETIKVASELAELLFVVSDHGFSRYRFALNINSLLDKMGLVAKTREKLLKDTIYFHQRQTINIKTPSWLYSFFSFKPMKPLVTKILEQIAGKNIRADPYEYVDPVRSKAFTLSHYSFGFHVKDVETRDFLLNEVKKMDLFAGVWKRTEIYHGPYVKKAPEIMFLPNLEKEYFVGTTAISPKTVSQKTYYDHHPEGIIIAYADHLSPEQIGKLKTFDLVPTILDYLGLPVPSDTDGEIIPQVAPVRKRPKRYDYLKHWQLIKQVQIAKIRLAKQI